MATMQSASDLTTDGWKVRGNAVYETGQTIEQDAGRVAAMANLTLVSYKASSGKYVPMTDVDPAVTPATLTCGAIGGTLAEFAALSSASFKIGVDNEAVFEVVCDFSGVNSILDTPGSYLCGTNGAIIAAGWDAVADGSGTFPIDGVDVVLTGMDFTDCLTFWDVQETINHHAAGRFTCTYDGDANAFQIISPTTGETSSVAALSTGGVGTDITAAGYLNGAAAGAATAGTGGEGLGESLVDIINAELAGRAECSFDGDKFIFWSNSSGLPESAISYLTAGTTGTDISGASYLNGLTGTGVLAAATGADGTDLPAGFYYGPEITAASLVAGDISDARILVGKDVEVDEDSITLENSLDLDDVVVSTGRTIRKELQRQGIYIRSTEYFQQAQPLT